MQDIPEAIAVEARAEIVWGKSPQRVLEFLQSKGVGDKSALALIETLMSERAAMIREDGIRKIIWGVLFALAPICYYLFSMWLGYWSLKLFAGLIVLGVYGLGKLTNGISMVLRPRSVAGDLANTE